ncbi:MAG: SDR family oxidoreductase [Candidatus Marinimicrobia bacterium]|nr:SDR family oxidoreductase [Candidatus Neomarinimicrobiota bacterium]
MSKTVLITGASTGIGRETARFFQHQGWNVAATMRSPNNEKELTKLQNVIAPKLDVTDENSIALAISTTIDKFGAIDVIVNNAGYSLTGIFEAATTKQLQHQYSVNVFGVMNVVRSILPHFRGKNDGTIINVSFVGGKMTLPLYSIYQSTKWAVSGFSEALQFELRPFNIKVKIIEPGAVITDFYNRSMSHTKKDGLTDYDDYVQKIHAVNDKFVSRGNKPIKTAKIIFKAATNNNWKLYYPSGGDAKIFLKLRKLLPVRWFNGFINRTYK